MKYIVLDVYDNSWEIFDHSVDAEKCAGEWIKTWKNHPNRVKNRERCIKIGTINDAVDLLKD